MIEVKDLNKSFGAKQILKGISATFEAGKCNLIIGASGSGKTVLMKSIVGLIPVNSGHIIYNHDTDFINIDDAGRKELRKQIGMLFQGSALFDSMSVEKNVIFPLNMFTNMTYKEKMHRVNECLERVNLKDVNKLLPNELSGGMKKRVGIARAIVMNPKYLFCDEPNSGLDPQTSIVIDKLIKDITDDYKITTIVNTHDMNSVMEIGDYVLFLYKGEKYWEGHRDDIMNATNQQLNDFIFAGKFFREIKEQNTKRLSDEKNK